jgi:hypothetical protein
VSSEAVLSQAGQCFETASQVAIQQGAKALAVRAEALLFSLKKNQGEISD